MSLQDEHCDGKWLLRAILPIRSGITAAPFVMHRKEVDMDKKLNLEMNMQEIDISKLKPADYNPRKRLYPGDKDYEDIKNSFFEFGYIDPIIINKDMTIISGHQRYFVLSDLGVEKVWCNVVELDKLREKAANIGLNKISGEWENEMLVDLLEELEGEGYDFHLTGFSDEEFDELVKSLESDDEDGEQDGEGYQGDGAYEEQPSFVEQGDIWLLGKHRLMCGDSSNPEDVKKLMDGKAANVVITDPPYNVDYGTTEVLRGQTVDHKIANDNMSTQHFREFLTAVYRNAADSLMDGGAVYSFASDKYIDSFIQSINDGGLKFSQMCVWEKDFIILGNFDYQSQHELVIYAYKNTAKRNFYGGRNKSSIWKFDHLRKAKLHPTMKPLPLIGFPIRNSTQENGIVLDLFGGSGTTLIAAEQLGRSAYVMEIDPVFASTIVRRYTAFKHGTGDIRVIRYGKEMPCEEVYIPTEQDYAYKDGSVDDAQKSDLFEPEIEDLEV